MTLITSRELGNGRASQAPLGDEGMRRQETIVSSVIPKRGSAEAERIEYLRQVTDASDAEELLTVVAQIVARLLGTETDAGQVDGLDVA
jgi:hypothetical protein